MNNVFRSIVAVAVLATAGVAQAEVRGLGSGVRTHDGFFLQMDLGLGGMGSSMDTTPEYELSGGSGQFSIGIGGAVTPNFILAGQLWGVSVPEPKAEFDGDEGELDATFSMSGVGVQLVYYFMPANVYLSATPSITQLSLDDGFDTYETEYGFGVKLAVGKEWWVSDNWALGLNGQLALSSNADSDVEDAPTWGTAWYGVGFSATFN